MNTSIRKALFAAMAMLTATRAYGWDEDTCSSGSIAGAIPDGGAPVCDGGAGGTTGTTNCYREPTCADPNPLMGANVAMNGSGQPLAFDHSTAHFEMTYLMARCVGVSNAEAQQIAAADAATDMSSPYCGSQASNSNNAGAFYYNGYACGYDTNTTNNRGDPSLSAVPFYPTDGTHPALRWAHTDRCRRVTGNPAVGTGHGEFFHYPYWETTAGSSTNNLATLQNWAFGTSATLIDPAARNSSSAVAPCDMATVPTSGTTPTGVCPAPTVLSASQYPSNIRNVCNYTTSSEWTMPAPAALGSTSDPSKPFRFGVYLHAQGDSYSHYTCQEWSGQPRDATTGEIHVAATSSATTHATTSYNDSARCGRLTSATTPTNSQCVTACDLVAHDLEWGDSSVQAMADATAVSTLQIRARGGLMIVWDRLLAYKNRSSRDNSSAVQAYRRSIPGGYAIHYDASARQQYVRDQIALGNAGNNYVANSPCLCPNGVFDWVSDSSAAGGHCATLDAVRVSTGSAVAQAQSTQVMALTVRLGTPVRLYAYADAHRISGAREDVAVSTVSNWTSSNPGVFTVNNDTASSGLGTVTAVTAGTANLTVRRLGVNAIVAITVTP